MTYAELCAEVGNQLEIDQADYDRFNLAKNANKAVRYMARTLPDEVIPELLRAEMKDFETTGAFEPAADYIRTVRIFLTYTGTAAQWAGAQATFIRPQDWPPFHSLSDMPTTSYPKFTFFGDFVSVAPTGKNGIIFVYPGPAVKITNGVYHEYIGFKDPVDSTHDVPLGEKLRNPLIHLTSRLVCLVEHFDPARAVAFNELYKEELATMLPPVVTAQP